MILVKTIVDFYADRKATYIDAEVFADLSQLPDYQFRNLVVTGQQSARNFRFDFGALCYSKRTNLKIKSGCCQVIESSLDLVLEKVFGLYVKNKLANCAKTSVHYFWTQLKNFAEYYFENLQDLDFNDYEACCIAYEQHTQMLLFKKAQLLSSPDKKGLSNLSNSQLIFAELICLYHKKDFKKFKETFVVLSRVSLNSISETVTLEELSCFYDFNKKIFYALKDFLMNKEDYPFTFSHTEGGNLQIVHYPVDGFVQTMKKKLFKADGFLVNRTELQVVINSIDSSFCNFNPDSHKKYLESMYNQFLEKLYEKRSDKDLDTARLINYAVSAFAMCFYCESSINTSLIHNIEIDDLNNFESSTKGLKLCVIKPRAGYKKIELLIAVKMFQLIEDYKEFRLWVLSLVGQKDIPNLFISLSTKLGEVNSYCDSINGFSGYATGNYKRWLLSYIPKFKWINPTTIRKSTSTIFFNKSKSLLVASKKLGNTPTVISRHYIESSNQEFAEQVSGFFDTVHNEIANKFRKNNKIITVRINECSERTAMGGCRELVPERHIGFTNDLEKPHCSNPSSCLFCQNYVVHSDEEDIRKLMSLKKILSMSDKNDEVAIITRRINEILKILFNKFPANKNIFLDVANSVELGSFDEYWEDHLNLLLDLGEEFYD